MVARAALPSRVLPSRGPILAQPAGASTGFPRCRWIGREILYPRRPQPWGMKMRARTRQKWAVVLRVTAISTALGIGFTATAGGAYGAGVADGAALGFLLSVLDAFFLSGAAL